jgi:leucyl-tRNA synthetase
MVVQVNGKVRDQIEVETAFSKEQILKQARSGQKMQKWLSGQEIKKEIYVPGKLVNFVV